jgi:hypothetical protein
MSINPFSEVKDYPSMRAKIGLYTFVEILISISVLQSCIPSMKSFFSLSPLTVKVLGADIGIGTLLVGILLASASYVIKLHDQISNLLGIRKRFDINEILKPLAIISGVSLNVQQIQQFREKRHLLMSKTFYKFASSGPGKAVIDSHYIHMALTQWSWYWITIELCAVTILTAIGLAFAKLWLPVTCLITFVLMLIWFLQWLRNDCINYALQQIEEITGDGQRRTAIEKEFNAI